MKKVFKYLALALVALIFIGTFVFLYSKSRPEVITWQELPVSVMDITRTSVVTGKVEPRNEVNIKPQINGIISELYKEAGEMVKEGEVIAKLKVIPDMGSLSSAESRLRLSEMNLKQAETDHNRQKALYDKELVSMEEYDKVLQVYNQAKEERSAAQEALEVIRDGVSSSNAGSSSTLVRSTITGLILDIPVKVGNSVIQANTMNDGTTVATVADMSDLIFNGSIDETEVGALVTGMPMNITIGALPDYSSKATLEYISPKATESNGASQFQIKAAIVPSQTHTIRAGYSANAEIVLQEAKEVLSVPESALEFSADSIFVYLMTSPQVFEKIPVTTGISDGINIQVLSGLSEGQIVRGTQNITE